MLMIFGGLVIAMLICAFMAFRASHLIFSALWLAGCSAFLSLLLYLLGAYAVAVIELSVGAGLVTVLFVFAISIVGEDHVAAKAIVPKPLALIVSLVSIVLLGFMTLSSLVTLPATVEAPFSEVLWQQRGLDMLVQSGLLFAAVVGLLGLLAEAKVPLGITQATAPLPAKQTTAVPSHPIVPAATSTTEVQA